MTDPDVILRDDFAEIVGRLDLTNTRGETGTLSLNPTDESITIGDDATEVGTERVRTGAIRTGEMDLGGGREYADEGRLRVHRGGDQDMQPVPGVDINGGGVSTGRNWAAEVTVYDDGNQSIRIGPDHITMDGGELTGPTRIESTDELQVGAATSEDQSRELTKSEDGSSGSDYEYTAGDVTVKGATGSGGEADTAVSIRGAEPNRNGGSASLFHADGLRTVDVDAGDDRYSITVEDVSGRVGSIGLDGPAGEVGVSIDDHDLLAGE